MSKAAQSFFVVTKVVVRNAMFALVVLRGCENRHEFSRAAKFAIIDRINDGDNAGSKKNNDKKKTRVRMTTLCKMRHCLRLFFSLHSSVLRRWRFDSRHAVLKRRFVICSTRNKQFDTRIRAQFDSYGAFELIIGPFWRRTAAKSCSA